MSVVKQFVSGLAAFGLLAAAASVTSVGGASAQSEPPLDGTAPFVIEFADTDTQVAPADIQELIASLQAQPAPSDPGEQAALQASAVGGQISVNYIDNTPYDVRQIVNMAVADWNSVLSIPAGAPIVVELHWKPLGQGLLGAAGPAVMIRNEGNLPTSDMYPIALANALSGTDLRPTMPEIRVTLASNLYNVAGGWYAGVDGLPSDRRDLYSTIVHELGHGLGFIGSATGVYGGTPSLGSTPFVYDRLVRYNGAPLIGSSQVAAALTSNNLGLNIDGERLREVFAPTSFSPGSSFSHFDGTTSLPGRPGSMMAPALGRGQTHRSIDSVILSVMYQIGWKLNVGVLAPAIYTLTGTDGAVSPRWSVGLRTQGVPPVRFEVAATRPGSNSSATAGPADTSVTVSGLVNYEDYDITVTAVGIDGSRSSATMETTGRPRLVNVSGNGLTQTVIWEPLTSPGSNSVAYVVQRSREGGPFQTITTIGGRSYVDESLEPGIYQYRVFGTHAGVNTPGANSQFIGVSPTYVRPFELDGQIARLYQAYLGRPADAGVVYWIQHRTAGDSLATVAAAFEASPEFTQKYGQLSNSGFVDLVYRDVIGRAPDSGGYNYWLSRLNAGMSRSTLMIGFSESPEFAAITGTVPAAPAANSAVYRIYVAYFLRAPDRSGLDYWVNAVNQGLSLEGVSAQFAASPEFDTSYGSLTNAEFVTLVYANVLTRFADDAGAAYWVSQLDAGVARSEVMLGFANGREFLGFTGTLPWTG